MYAIRSYYDLIGESLQESALGLRLRLIGRVGKFRVDGRGDFVGSVRVRNAHGVPTHQSLAELPGLIEKVITKEKLGGIGAFLRPVVNTHQVELPGQLTTLRITSYNVCYTKLLRKSR